jgi:predicted N-acetyltransferase YhbS
VSEIRIRKMLPEDLPAVIAILERWNMAPRRPTPEVPDPERSGISVENGFVAEIEGRIVGACSYYLLGDGNAETASLAVDPSVRGRGVGHRLQQARMDEMRRRGVTRVRTEADRVETIRWYVERFGYRIVGRNPKKHDFGVSTVDHWTLLELDLD